MKCKKMASGSEKIKKTGILHFQFTIFVIFSPIQEGEIFMVSVLRFHALSLLLCLET